jgi:hypothetical protein
VNVLHWWTKEQIFSIRDYCASRADYKPSTILQISVRTVVADESKATNETGGIILNSRCMRHTHSITTQNTDAVCLCWCLHSSAWYYTPNAIRPHSYGRSSKPTVFFLRLVLLPSLEIWFPPTAHWFSIWFEVPKAVAKKVLSAGSALASPTGGDRSVCMVHSPNRGTEVFFIFFLEFRSFVQRQRTFRRTCRLHLKTK